MISAGGEFLSRLGAFGGILIDEVAQCTELGAIGMSTHSLKILEGEGLRT